MNKSKFKVGDRVRWRFEPSIDFPPGAVAEVLDVKLDPHEAWRGPQITIRCEGREFYSPYSERAFELAEPRAQDVSSKLDEIIAILKEIRNA